MQLAVNIFICYAHEDEKSLDKLKSFLQPLQRQGLIGSWYDCDISANKDWKLIFNKYLEEAQIILFLVSPDFMNSDFCYSVEMQLVMERHEQRKAVVIPIILRPANWASAPFAKLQVLPKDAKPVMSWSNQDEAFLDITEGIRNAIESFVSSEEGHYELPISSKKVPVSSPDKIPLSIPLPEPIPSSKASPSAPVIVQVVHEQEVRAAVSDTPKMDPKDDRLEFRPYVDALYGFITAPETTTPLVISINGSWGSGKSSLMRMLKQRLEPREGYYSDLLWQGLAWHVGQFGHRKLTDGQKENQKLVQQRIKHLQLSKYMLKRGHVKEGEKMERILEHIAKSEPMELLYYPTVWFNAWKFTEESQIWAALASDIINQLNGKQYAFLTRIIFWLQLKRERANLLAAMRPALLNLLVIIVLAMVSVLYPSFIYPFIVSHILPFFQTLFPTQNVAMGAASTTATVGGVALFLSTAAQILKAARQISKAHPFQIPINTIIDNPNYQEKIGYISQFSQDFRRIVNVATCSSSPAWETLKLVIFIDDLDRCRPLQAAGIIEAISLFLDSEQCVFVLGLDANTVAASIEAKYKELVEEIHHDQPEIVSFGRAFLEKIIQISVTIPHADSTHIEQLVISLTQGTAVNGTSSTSQSGAGTTSPSTPSSSSSVRTELNAAHEATLAVQRDVRAYFKNEDVQNAIKEASELLKRNPRRIKQFINLFRLKVFLINRDEKKMNYFEKSKEKLKDFVFMLAWSMQWSEVARLVVISPHSAEVCDYLLFLCEKYETSAEKTSDQQVQADKKASQPSNHSDTVETFRYDPSVFDTIIEDLMARRSKVENLPAHWCYLPWEEWIYDKGFRHCIMRFRDQWQLRKDGETSPLFELIRM